MRRLRGSIVRFGGLFNKQRKERELDDEIESHLQLHIEDNHRLGMTPEEARRQALIKSRGIESTKEAYRRLMAKTPRMATPSAHACANGGEAVE